VSFTPSVASSLADPIAGVPVQSGGDGASAGYVPSPVSFVSPDGDGDGDDDEDYNAKSNGGYGSRARDDRDRDRDTDAASAGPASWKDSGRAAKQDTVFDVSAGRRRAVVFEEDDDLDVPDFLK
jgi:hypothetical protein